MSPTDTSGGILKRGPPKRSWGWVAPTGTVAQQRYQATPHTCPGGPRAICSLQQLCIFRQSQSLTLGRQHRSHCCVLWISGNGMCLPVPLWIFFVFLPSLLSLTHRRNYCFTILNLNGIKVINLYHPHSKSDCIINIIFQGQTTDILHLLFNRGKYLNIFVVARLTSLVQGVYSDWVEIIFQEFILSIAWHFKLTGPKLDFSQDCLTFLCWNGVTHPGGKWAPGLKYNYACEHMGEFSGDLWR